jgi:hypothetical protein
MWLPGLKPFRDKFGCSFPSTAFAEPCGKVHLNIAVRLLNRCEWKKIADLSHLQTNGSAKIHLLKLFYTTNALNRHESVLDLFGAPSLRVALGSSRQRKSSPCQSRREEVPSSERKQKRSIRSEDWTVSV